MPDSLFSLFFFMSCREGSLLACSSRQGRPLLRKAHSERGWKTPSPYLFLMAISFSSFIYKQNQYVNKKTRFIPPVYVYLHLPHLRGEMGSVCSYCTAGSHSLQAGWIASALAPSTSWSRTSEACKIWHKHQCLISIHRKPYVHFCMFEWTPKFTIWTYWQHLKCIYLCTDLET